MFSFPEIKYMGYSENNSFLKIIFQGKKQTGAIKNTKENLSVISFPCLLA